MGINTGYGIFHLLKARVDLGHGGRDGRIFFYLLYDVNEVRLFHFRYVDSDNPDFPEYGIKMEWNSFCSFIDGGHSESYFSDIQDMVSDLSSVLKETGVYNLKEDNIEKVKELENTFSLRTRQFYDGQVVSFLRFDVITVAEAETLMALFFEEVESADSYEDESAEGENQVEKEVPKAVVSCSIVMDPLRGVPVSSIVSGDTVSLAIPETSFVYRNMKAQYGNEFTGQVERIVKSIKESDTERIVMEFDLFDDVAAVSVAQKSLKIKASPIAGSDGDRISFPFTPLTLLVISGVCFVALFLLIYHFLS